MLIKFSSHISAEVWVKNQPIDEENLKNAYKETAESSVKWYLIKNTIISEIGLDVSLFSNNFSLYIFS